MFKFNSESLKSLIIYYNNSKAQTQSYKNRYFNIIIKSGNYSYYIKKGVNILYHKISIYKHEIQYCDNIRTF